MKIGHWRYKINQCPGKGRCVIADSILPANVIIAKYGGKLITGEQADKKKDDTYVFFFLLKNKWMALDATKEPKRVSIGRLFNHSRRNPNIQPRIHGRNILFHTLRKIYPGEELVYDYGGKNVNEHKWLKD